MTITFERPIGAHRDIKELQYLSALHQTGNNLRPDATITGEHISRMSCVVYTVCLAISGVK